jgi:4-amino-4-deoxy-L-arabinose transferase-like glycosyltransferase
MFILMPILLFSILFLYSIGSIPYLDGNIDFVKTYDYATGGMDLLLKNWNSVHPPFKEFLTTIFFTIFGINATSYTLPGLVLGVIGVWGFYQLTKKLAGKSTARLSSILLATSPLYLSVGIFGLTDFYLTVFVILSLYFLLSEKILWYCLTAIIACLTKETGLTLVASVLIVEVIYTIKAVLQKKFTLSSTTRFLFLLAPFAVSYLWIWFLQSNNKGVWGDWNFAQTRGEGTLYTIFHNVITFSFFNEYAYQNWLHLFVLNFNWVLTLIFIAGSFLFMKKEGLPKLLRLLRKPTIKTKVIFSMILYAFIYLISVLSFQTYTITRYVLPLTPLLLLGVSWILVSVLKLKTNAIIAAVIIFIPLQLFFSADPVSTKLWGKTTILGEDFYALNQHLSGNDGITYNMQYNRLVKKRSQKILLPNESNSKILDDCYWLFPDPNNDNKTMNILGLEDKKSALCK